ncbi:hypothetical protein [Salipiger bermudensis]|uniref:hypothetical protein n=1 Tax=Salipiger bermudensis TaxID=344736 RepID=UPI00058E044F|nr:hypothetical protein [Salipiger bermudensis]
MVGWLKSLLELNARVFSLLEDVQKINVRVNDVDDRVRNMGREVSELQGMLKAYRFSNTDGSQNERDLKLIESKVDLLAAKLDIKTISHADNKPVERLEVEDAKPDEDENEVE